MLYTLSDLNNEELGWGRRDESWNFLNGCEELGLESWFKLGDRDLALHVFRTQGLAENRTLSEITHSLCDRFEIPVSIVPMSDSPIRTMLATESGKMSFQEYFVKHQCTPAVERIWFDGADSADISTALEDVIGSAELEAVIICPSNPFLSIAPVLAVSSMKSRLASLGVPIVVVSPIINGKSIKGPTSKLMCELGLSSSVITIAEIYKDIATHIVIDNQDAKETAELLCQ